jgi:mediator of RNA polymerase II transcription subunit 16
MYFPAVKTEGQFQYGGTNHKPFGPFHPIPGKSALVTVTVNGVLRLVYQLFDPRWGHVQAEIDNIMSSDHLITHASFCSDTGWQSRLRLSCES